MTCPQQPTCVTLDMNKCNIGLSSKGENPVVSGRLTGRVLECTFDPSKIDTEEQYNNFISNKFGNVETLNKFYCAQSTTQGCPLDMEGKVQSTCSRMLSSKFPQCKEINSQYNEMTDFIKNQYCTDNPTNYSCGCINRTQQDAYKLGKRYYPIQDKCWWLPCNSATNNLISSDVQKSDKCPDNICQQVAIIDNPKDKAIIKGNDYVLQCNQSSGGGGGGGDGGDGGDGGGSGGGGSGGGGGGSGGGGGDSGKIKKKKTLMIVGISVSAAVFAALCAALLFYILSKRRRATVKR